MASMAETRAVNFSDSVRVAHDGGLGDLAHQALRPQAMAFEGGANAPGQPTHALSPQALLRAFTTLGCGASPPAFSLTVRGHHFGLGQPLSPGAERNRSGRLKLTDKRAVLVP